MQAVAASAVGRTGMRSVLRGVLLAAGVAARATKRTVERFLRQEALIYVTREITLADILLYSTATFEDVPPEPEPEPALVPEQDIGSGIIAIVGGMIFTAVALLVVNSIADAVDEYSRAKRRCRPYAQAGQRHSRSSHEAATGPAPALKPKPAPAPAAPPPHGAMAYFDASRAVAAWARECEAAGIKHRILQRK